MNPDEPDAYCPACFTGMRFESSNPDDWRCDGCGALFDADTWLDAAKLRAKKAEDDRRWSEAEASGLIVPRGKGEAEGA